MRSHVSRSGRWLLALCALLALGCEQGSETGSSRRTTLQTDVLVARSTDDGATWSAPAPLNPATVVRLGSEATPHALPDAAGTWLAAWRSSKLGDLPSPDGDLVLARSTDGGASWAGYAELNNNAGTDEGGDDRVRLVTDAPGSWVAIWQSWDSLGDTIGVDGDILIARSADGGLTWTDPAPLNDTAYTDTQDDNRPQIATDGAGNWVAVWYTPEFYNRPPPEPGEDPPLADRDILMTRSTDDGATWSPVVALNNNAALDPGGDTNPQITNYGSTWIAIWEIKDPSVSNTYPNAFGLDADILYARSTDAGATWTDPAPVNNNARHQTIRVGGRPVYTPGDDRFPQLATYDGTLWVAVWSSEDTLYSIGTPGDKVGEDADILVARSTNAGATWTNPAPVNNNAGTDTASDTNPTLTTDGTTWLVTWLSRNPQGGPLGSDHDILMARSTDGGVTWTDPEPLNTNAASDTGTEAEQSVATDGTNWVATWHTTDWN